MPDSAHAGWEAWDFFCGSRLEPNGSGQYRQRHLGRSAHPANAAVLHGSPEGTMRQSDHQPNTLWLPTSVPP
jgi:hypothetical protein